MAKEITDSMKENRKRIIAFNIWELVLGIAKHRVGMIDDDELMLICKHQEEMAINERKSLLIASISEISEMDGGLERLIEDIAKTIGDQDKE